MEIDMTAPQGKLLKEIENKNPKLFNEIVRKQIENHTVSFEFNGKHYKLKIA